MIPTPTNPTGPREEDADDEREAMDCTRFFCTRFL
jgi:hypothetical protein